MPYRHQADSEGSGIGWQSPSSFSGPAAGCSLAVYSQFISFLLWPLNYPSPLLFLVKQTFDKSRTTFDWSLPFRAWKCVILPLLLVNRQSDPPRPEFSLTLPRTLFLWAPSTPIDLIKMVKIQILPKLITKSCFSAWSSVSGCLEKTARVIHIFFEGTWTITKAHLRPWVQSELYFVCAQLETRVTPLSTVGSSDSPFVPIVNFPSLHK